MPTGFRKESVAGPDMFLILLAYLAFFSIALPDSTLGVAWPSMRLDFGQPIGAAGVVPPIGVAATLVSTALAARLANRFGVGRLLAGSTLLSVAGLVVSASSLRFEHFLISVVLIGLSSGAVDATLNAYAARTFGPRRINLLHASYVVGAAASPLLVTATVQSGLGWRLPYLIIAVVQLALGLFFLRTHRRWGSAGRDAERGERARWRQHRPLDVSLGLATVAVQTGIESSVALWAFTFLTLGVGVDPVLAGTLSSGYWLTMFAGRVLLGWLAERTGPWPVLGGAAVGLVLAGVLAMLNTPVAAIAAVLLFGLAAAPIYPLLTLTTAERTSTAIVDTVIGLQAGASALGAAILPLVVGLAMNQAVSAFAPVLLVACLVAAALHAVLQLRRPRSRGSRTRETA